MQKKWTIVIGLFVLVVVVGGIVLGLGEVIYLNSDGQRGWSLGAAMYEMLGWDAEAFRTDFGWHVAQPGQAHLLEDSNNAGVAPYIGYPFGRGNRHGGFAGGYAGHRGGALFWLAILGIGYLLYGWQKQSTAKINAA